MTYWDDEDNRKVLREEKLREKRGLLVKSAPPPVESAIDKEHLDKVLAILEQQMQLTAAQTQQLNELHQALDNQGQVLSKLLEKEPVVITEGGITKTVKRASEELPILGDIDVNVVDTSGIETQGEAGEQKTEGNSVKDRVARLRELKNKGK